MICERIKPHPFVADFIKEYLLIHMKFGENDNAPVKAYPVNQKQGIRFQFRGETIAEAPSLDIREKLPSVNFFGTFNERKNLQMTREFMVAIAEFQPCALSHFLNINMQELPNGKLDASLILGPEINTVNDELANAPNYQSLPIILDRYFMSKIKKLKPDFLPIDLLSRHIYDHPMGFTLDNAVKDACMSLRNFERKFLFRTGLTPKYFARICRFYQAYEKKELFPNLDWLTIAVQNGYYDYQHLVKDFKRFAEVTPNVFWEQIKLNFEIRLQVNPDYVGI